MHSFVASIKLARGPTTIRTENGQLAVYVFVDIRDRDLGGYVADAQRAVAAQVQFQPGYYIAESEAKRPVIPTEGGHPVYGVNRVPLPAV